MKFNGVSKKENGKYAKIDGKWYTMPENVRKYVLAQKFQDSDDVNIKAHTETVNGREVQILDYIEKIDGSSSSAKSSSSTQTKTYGQKSPEEREDIKKQAVMKAVCSAIPGCQGLDANTLGDLIVSLYERALAKINE